MTKAEAFKKALEARGFKSVPTRQHKGSRSIRYAYKMVGELEMLGRKDQVTYWITECGLIHAGRTTKSAVSVVEFFQKQLLHEAGYE